MSHPALSVERLCYDRPGGDGQLRPHECTVDFRHLDRQTFHNRDLAEEVLQLFGKQAAQVSARIGQAEIAERRVLSHALKGSANNVGAFPIAHAAAAVEDLPADDQAIAVLIERISHFRQSAASLFR